MVKVNFTYALKRFYPGMQSIESDAGTLQELVAQLDIHYKGLSGYIIEENGALRKHVNIFVDNELVKDRQTLSDSLSKASEVYIMQALSGG